MKELISVFFGKEAEINCYAASELGKDTVIKEDVVIASTYALYQNLRGRLENTGNLFVIDRTLYKKTVEELKAIPRGTRALIVNLDYKNTMELIGLLKEAGLDNIEMSPYWPGAEYDRSVKLAITPDERHLVPDSCEEIIDIGERPIKISQVLRIAEALGIEDPLETPEAKALTDSLFESAERDYWLREMMVLAGKQDSILSLIDSGILLANNLGYIYYINDIARRMLSTGGYHISGFNVFDVIPELRNATRNGSWRPYETMIRVNGREVMCQLKEIKVREATDSVLVILEDLAESESKKRKYLKRMRGAGHFAKYTFDDIHGNSASIIECKNIAHRIAKSNSNVYIKGESGVGKELFAQSIHNASNRRNYPFVAINCSALPENLLESELYGYEEGAFTGASKGGKIGLFELAHRGTLFLDEVAELPRPLQAKLLRAIEEKVILRVGGSELIPVDVRIICATNKDLLRLVREGSFREDLYYRLCVLPLAVPPLRDRKGDIRLLFGAMKEEMKASFKLNA
ncbi:MAG: sigma 54-interacting transcriptional regulator, partial [Firmicutes bacterium]|nr:sigma 54-interacting transcriptional regulator [Bacillota bacterium]